MQDTLGEIIEECERKMGPAIVCFFTSEFSFSYQVHI